MTGNILKVIATLFICYLLGLIFGSIFGIFLGGIPAILFKEIIYFNQPVLMSITLSLILGGLLGLLAVQIANKIFVTSDKPLIGVLLGIAIGFIVVFFVEGVMYFPDLETFIEPMHTYPIFYTGSLGTYIGVTIFPIIGGTRVIRDILADNI